MSWASFKGFQAKAGPFSPPQTFLAVISSETRSGDREIREMHLLTIPFITRTFSLFAVIRPSIN